MTDLDTASASKSALNLGGGKKSDMSLFDVDFALNLPIENSLQWETEDLHPIRIKLICTMLHWTGF